MVSTPASSTDMIPAQDQLVETIVQPVQFGTVAVEHAAQAVLLARGRPLAAAAFDTAHQRSISDAHCGAVTGSAACAAAPSPASLAQMRA